MIHLLSWLIPLAASAAVVDARIDFSDGRRAQTVILEYGPPAPPALVLTRAGRELALRRAAEIAQQGTFQILRSHPGAVSRVRSFWIANAVTATAPVLREIARDPNLVEMRLPLRMRLISPAVGAPPREGAYEDSLVKMRVPEVRARGLDGRGVRIGILDTGIDDTHPDLRGKVLAFKDVSEPEEPVAQGAYDDHGHGTHVAGTIAGGAASGTAIGVAPAVGLIIGKIFNSEGSADEAQILDGLQWIADPDGDPMTDDAPKAVSNSWGSDVPGGDPARKATCRAIAAWRDLSILPIFAAGNSGPRERSVAVPAACPAALAVGATDLNDGIARFSSRGPVIWSTGTVVKPSLSAPGVDVLSAAPGGRYVAMSGTSMATPHVAGVAALIFQARPRATPEEVAAALLNGSIDLGVPGADITFGAGRLDAVKALEAARFLRN